MRKQLPVPFPPTWRERFFRRVGLWSWYGRLAYWGWAWAQKEIRPTHPHAPEVGYRYTQLKQEFNK